MKGETTMKKLPEVDVGAMELHRMIIAPIRSKLLVAGIEPGQNERM